MKPTWEQFKQAFQTFSGDLDIVNKPETPTISPFGPTNGLDNDGHRQYNVTQIPPTMTEADFLAELKTRTVIKIGCMDKDASGPEYDSLADEEQRQRMNILMAGGALQISDDRMKSLKDIVSYLSDPAKTGHIQKVFLRDHDNVCGYVKYELGLSGLAPDQSLPDILHVQPGADEEDIAMKRLLLQASQESGASAAFGNRVELGLEIIDRNGHVTVDQNFDNLEPLPLEKIINKE